MAMYPGSRWPRHRYCHHDTCQLSLGHHLNYSCHGRQSPLLSCQHQYHNTCLDFFILRLKNEDGTSGTVLS